MLLRIFMRLLSETPGVLAAVISADGIALDLNQAQADFLGVPLDSVLGRSYWDYVPAGVRGACEAAARRVVEAGRPYAMEVGLGPRCYQNWLSPVLDSEGRTVAVSILAWDVTGHGPPADTQGESGRGTERLRKAVAAIHASEDLDSGLARLVRAVTELGDFECAGVYLIEGPEVVLRCHAGLDPQCAVAVARGRLTAPYVRTILAEPDRLVNLTGRLESSRRFAEQYGLKQLYAIGMRSGSRHLGFLIVGSRSEAERRAREIEPVRILAMEVESIFARMELRERARRITREQQAILETIPAGVSRLRNWIVEWANPAHDTMLGYRAGETVGMEVSRFFTDPDEYARVRAETPERLAGGGTYRTESLLRRKDGGAFWCEAVGRSVSQDDPGEGVIWVLHDVSERRRMTETLRHNERRLRRLSDNIPSGIIYQLLLERDGSRRFVYVSAGVKAIHGLSPEVVLADATSVYRMVLEEDRKRLAEAELRCQTELNQLKIELRIRDATGTVKWLYLVSTPTPMAEGSVMWDGLVLDITERKLLEDRLRDAQRMESSGLLAGGIAHEFNNILAAALLTLNLLKGECDNLEARGLVRELEGLTNREADLIRQLLALSGKTMMRKQPLDLAEVVHNRCAMLAQVMQGGVRLEVAAERDLPLVDADRSLVEEVVLQLCLNARDAMPHGGRLRIALARANPGVKDSQACADSAAAGFVCLQVSDTGCGMTEETRKRVFEPFFTTKEIGQGAGLGLAAVRGIVHQHSGWVEVESVVGKGSTFKLYFPEAARARAGVPSPPGSEGQVNASTILLVEDEVVLRKATKTYLQRLGYRVLDAANATEAEAIWVAERDTIKLLFTDMVMPGGISGFAFAESLLARQPALKVILTSGYSSEVLGLDSTPTGGVVYLPKPCPPQVLASTLKGLFEAPGSTRLSSRLLTAATVDGAREIQCVRRIGVDAERAKSGQNCNAAGDSHRPG